MPITADRPANERSLLETVISSSVGLEGTFIHHDENGLADLVRKDILQSVNVISNQDLGGSWYKLTDYSQKLVNYGFELTCPQSLIHFFRTGIPTDQCTGIELIHRLTRLGWKDSQTNRPKSVSPYSLGNDKTWWRKSGSVATLSLLYLRTLIIAEKILARGEMTHIHNFQPQAYYEALLKTEGSTVVLPNQPLVYYKQIMKGKELKRGRGRKGHVGQEHAATIDDEVEQEVST